MADTPKPGAPDASGSDPSPSVPPAESSPTPASDASADTPSSGDDATSASASTDAPVPAPAKDVASVESTSESTDAAETAAPAETTEDSSESSDAPEPAADSAASDADTTTQSAEDAATIVLDSLPGSEAEAPEVDEESPTTVRKSPISGQVTLIPTDGPVERPPAAPRRSEGEVDEHAKTRIFEPAEVAAMMAENEAEESASDASDADEPEPADAPLPESFDELDLPDAVRSAVAAMGWSVPTAVQALTFPLVTNGHDVLVQSQTGSGKTGAFCLPWLAQRFEAGDASKTGVQLLVLTPTRELAKQVCEQLQQMAKQTDVRTLPIYGGTAMQPQLQALRDGVHAVVGTPGRILDHIRRRSLKLDRVRMAVLDEADEMLSMGFLEDIHAILDACSTERQTCLFSATVPPDIERIARRYMRDPTPVMLSGDQVAAAEINHVYYQVSGTIKVRDLLDMISIEEPANALVFCNTREETYMVASALRREGFNAEPLSSDLTQAARERVMGRMRDGQLRFLVATDVASRGIDISHIGHVINYSFPENAESYVHRTGRTGRAGRPGVAISLIAPQELGNHYYLKLQYPSIEFEERSLPPASDLTKQRLEHKLDQVSRLFPELVAPEWTLLTRHLVSDPRGEQVVAYLLKEAMTRVARERESDQDDIELRRPRGDDRRGRGRGRRDRDDRFDRGERRGRGRWEDEGDDERRGRRRDRDRDRDRDQDSGHERGERRGRGRWEDEGDDERRGRRRDRDRDQTDSGHERGERRGRGRWEDEGDDERRGRRRDPSDGGNDEAAGDGEERRGRRRRRDRGRRDDREGDEREGRRERGRRDRRDDREDGRKDRRDDREGRDGERRRRRRRNAEVHHDAEESAPTDEVADPSATAPANEAPAAEAPAAEAPAADDKATEVGEATEATETTEAVSEAPQADASDEAAPESITTGDDASTEDEGREGPSPEGEAAADEDEGGGRRRRRRRRRRRGRDRDRAPDEAGEGAEEEDAPVRGETEAPAPSTAFTPEETGDAPNEADAAEDTEAADEDAAVDPDQVVEAQSGSEITDPGTMTGLTARRRRRRRRRRGRRSEDEAGGEGKETQAEGSADASAEAHDGGEPPAEALDESSDDDAPDGKRRRRRRRGGRRRGRGAETKVAEAPKSPPVVHVSQEQIVIDIDESELEVVRDQFGEIDELDELTLKGRRRGVIDALQDEVELEDLSAADRDTEEADAEADADADTDDTDEDNGDEAAADGAEQSADAPNEASPTDEAPADPRELKKRKRRRRRRKKKAPPPPPELTAPPHKDFWEVWATRFTYQDFEDDTYLGGTAAVDEPEPAPEPEPPKMPAIEDEESFVRVRLNVGRKHGKKAAHVRELLAESFGLARKAVRDLTVGDASSRFRLGAKALVKLEELIQGFVFDGIDLTVTRLDPPAEPPEPAPASDDGGSDEAVPSEEASPESAGDLAPVEARDDAQPTEPAPEAAPSEDSIAADDDAAEDAAAADAPDSSDDAPAADASDDVAPPADAEAEAAPEPPADAEQSAPEPPTETSDALADAESTESDSEPAAEDTADATDAEASDEEPAEPSS